MSLAAPPADAAQPIDDPAAIRGADPALLGAALRASRQRTLARLASYERALAPTGMTVPYSPEVNPPLWEMGHLAWFQEYWIARNPDCHRGIDAPIDAPRMPSLREDADRHYDSSRVEHTARWRLPLADHAATRDFLDRTLDRTLDIMAAWRPSADPLHAPPYFAWLALMHEDMHGEAAVYMANKLSIPLDAGRPRAREDGDAEGGVMAAVEIPAGRCEIGSRAGACAFDNELPRQHVELAAFVIDAAPVSNAAFLAFVEAGGYEQRHCWTAAGWEWRQRHSAGWPRFWRRNGPAWEQRWFGAWEPIVAQAPVCNVTAHEADAWCRWAGRRLPDEREWECAARSHGSRAGRGAGHAFAWGDVWEWTATEFAGYPGFRAYPYREYAEVFFGKGYRVLRGGSWATQAHVASATFRNWDLPQRRQIFAGLRLAWDLD